MIKMKYMYNNFSIYLIWIQIRTSLHGRKRRKKINLHLLFRSIIMIKTPTLNPNIRFYQWLLMLHPSSSLKNKSQPLIAVTVGKADAWRCIACVFRRGKCVIRYIFTLSKSCFCDDCKNKSDNMVRSEAINEIITKDPFAFSKGDER